MSNNQWRKPMKIRFWASFLCFVFLLLFIKNIFAQESPEQRTRRTRAKAPEIGIVAKDFTLKTTDGKDFTLSDYRGKIVVLEFGACT